MSVTLPDLSAEILDLIVSFCDDKPSLAALARVSKLFRHLVLPRLYRGISLSHSYELQGTKGLRALTLTLLLRPEIAALVHSFTIRATYSTRHTDPDPEDEPEWTTWQQHPDLDHLLREAIDAQLAPDPEASGPPVTRAKSKEAGNDLIGSGQAEEWLRIARAGRNEASILALLLPKLVNLQSMDVPFAQEWSGSGREGDASDTRYIVEMLQRAEAGRKKLNGRPMFGKVTDVMIPGVEDKYPDDPEFFAQCVSLPAIKRLYGSNQGNEDDFSEDAESDIPFDRLESGTSSLELIHLRHSKLKSSNFLKLMRAPKSLKTLIYEVGNTWAWTPVQFLEMQQALNTQKTSLERLCLSTAYYYPYQDDTDELAPMDFRDFSALKHFRTAPVYLYGDESPSSEPGESESGDDAPATTQGVTQSTQVSLKEVLPSQLEIFDLLFCDNTPVLRRIALDLNEILAHKDERFPQLREVSIHSQEDASLKEVMTQLTSLPWRLKGVHFLVKHEGPESTPSDDEEPVGWGWDKEVRWAHCFHDEQGPITVLYDSEKDD